MITQASTILEALERYDAPRRSAVLVWFGQASVALRLGGATVLVDPFLSPHPERLRELRVHLALLPINGRDAEREALGIVGNMDATEAAQLAHEIGADAAVPLHWDMFASNPGDPPAFVAAAQTTVIVPQRGRPFVYTAPEATS